MKGEGEGEGEEGPSVVCCVVCVGCVRFGLVVACAHVHMWRCVFRTRRRPSRTQHVLHPLPGTSYAYVCVVVPYHHSVVNHARARVFARDIHTQLLILRERVCRCFHACHLGFVDFDKHGLREHDENVDNTQKEHPDQLLARGVGGALEALPLDHLEQEHGDGELAKGNHQRDHELGEVMPCAVALHRGNDLKPKTRNKAKRRRKGKRVMKKGKTTNEP